MLAAVTATTIYGQDPEGRSNDLLGNVRARSDILIDNDNQVKEDEYVDNELISDNVGYAHNWFANDGYTNDYANPYGGYAHDGFADGGYTNPYANPY